MSRKRERIPIPNQSYTNASEDSPSSLSNPFASQTAALSNTPLSASPPSFSGFLSKPSKWFSHPSAANKNNSSSTETHRVRAISSARRAAISGPTDPRPIIPAYSPKFSEVNTPSNQSVLDLTPATPFISANEDPPQHGYFDLKIMSSKTYSRSVDDLSRMQDQHLVLTNPPSRDQSFTMQTKAKIEAYRKNTTNFPFAFPSSPTATSFPLVSPEEADTGNNSVAFPKIQHNSSKSSLSTAAFAEIFRPSPIRSRTTSSFGREYQTDKIQSSQTPATLPRFQGHSPSISPTVSPPDPTVPSQDALKRSSQIVQFSGFLNRHTGSSAYQTFRSAHTLSNVLSKGWKPYKAVLKGSKLYFYKPPSDRNVEIKELFPQGVNPILSETAQANGTVEEGSEEPTRVKDEVRRRPRIYRGRNAHPELGPLTAGGFPARGTLDALLHEAIFGNCFGHNNDLSTAQKRFSSCMMLYLPRLMGRETFEREFICCAISFVNDAERHEQDSARAFASWLSHVYISLYRHPLDDKKWQSYRSSIMLLEDSAASTDDAQTPYSQQDTGLLSTGHLNDARFAINDLTDVHFLTLDPAILAESLSIFHVLCLPQTLKTSFSVDLVEYALEINGNTQAHPSFSYFFGSDESPHWLSRFIVAQVLNPSSSSPKTSPDIQVSKTYLRADLLAHWIKVAEHCRGAGDRCTWKAIEAALCSTPLARLEKVWRRTDLLTLRLFHSWTKDIDSPDVPMMTPWGGDILDKISALWPKAKVNFAGRDDIWDVETLLNTCDYVNMIQSQFVRSTLKPDSVQQDEMVARLVTFWQNVQTQTTSKFRAFEDFISLSMAAEPRSKGRFELHHWQRTSNAGAVQSAIPLGFVEALPTLSLIDRDVQRSKRDGIDVSPPQVHQTRISRLFYMMSVPGNPGLNDILRNISDGSGLVIPLYDGDLLVEVPEKSLDIPSRPSSIFEPSLERRTSQVRVTSGSTERKSSMARRGSLPVLPQANVSTSSGQPSESSLKAFVKAGTLDRLVDVLLFGLNGVSVSVADDNGEAPLRGGKTRPLKLDQGEFQTSWWAMFRSFVTPYVLFELLRKRFMLAAASANTQKAIYSAILHWIEKGDGIHDALDDVELFRTMTTFLSTPVKDNDGKAGKEWASLEALRQQVSGAFAKYSQRPQLYQHPLRQATVDSQPINYGSQPPSLDELDPETLVDNLDALAATAMRSVTLDDLIVTIDILETQSANRIDWYLNYDPIINSDEVEIQTIYSHLQEVEPSDLFSDTKESFYKLLPASIRGLIRAHAVIRKYVLSKIVTPRLGLRIRQARMEVLLKTIEVCRLRSADPSSKETFTNQLTARSFVEAAIISAIVAPESRFFSAAWNSVASARGTTAESLGSLLAMPVIQSVRNRSPLTVDIGWLLERFLELMSIPNLVEASVEGSTLINMEKRRYLHDLSIFFLSLRLYRPRKLQNVIERSDTERLNNMHRQVTGPAFDNRLLRDEAYHESLNGVTHHKRSQRPFAKIVQLQQEKCKRDKVAREKLTRERKAEQIRSDKREENLNRAMHPGRPNAHALKNQRSRRTISSAFLQLMRPISSAFISGDQPSNGTTPVQLRTAQELDFQPTGKPSLVISLAGATVKNFVNNIRLYLFNVVTEDGGRYLLQASTHSELESWTSHIVQTAKLTSAKRLTYIGNSTRPIFSQDQVEIPSQMGSQHPHAVFNVDLDILLQREAGNNPVAIGAVPQILERCLAEIEAKGLQEPGLYRVPGASSAINALRAQFDTGQEISFFERDYVDIFAICDVVKMWLRALPQAVFPEKSYQEAIQDIQIQDFEERLKAVRKVIHELPVNNMYLLRRVCEHLDRVTDYEEQNQMTAEALAVIFNPSLLRSPTNNFALLMQNMKYTSQLLQMLITHFHRVFDEADMEQDDEVDGDMADQIEDATLHNTESGQSVPVSSDIFHDYDPELEPSLNRARDGETIAS